MLRIASGTQRVACGGGGGGAFGARGSLTVARATPARFGSVRQLTGRGIHSQTAAARPRVYHAVRRPTVARACLPPSSSSRIATGRSAAAHRRLASAAQTPSGGMSTTAMVALGSALGILGVAGYGMISAPATDVTWSDAASRKLAAEQEGEYTVSHRARIRATYGYVVGGLGVTAASAVAMFRSGLHYRVMATNPLLFGIGSIVATIGCMSVASALDQHEHPVAKHAAWLGFNGAIALGLSPLGILGGPLVMRAAMATGAVVGSLSLVAASSPSDRFLKMGGYLGVGLGVLLAASVGSMVFPASALLTNVCLYGGMGLFGLFTLHDTQRIIHNARVAPSNGFDPMRESFGIYMDTINIFVRVAQMMAGSSSRRS